MRTSKSTAVAVTICLLSNIATWAADEQDREPQLGWEEIKSIPRGHVLHVRARIDSVGWSPDGRLIAIQTQAIDDDKRRRWSVQLHAADSGKPVATLTDTAEERLRIATKTEEPKFSVRFSPDGKRVACAVWAETHPDKLHKGNVKRRHWSEIRLWDVATGRDGERFSGAAQQGLGVAFRSDLLWCDYSPDGQRIAGGGKLVGEFPIAGSHIGGEVCVWDARSGKLKWSDRSTHTDIVYAVAFSPDGKLLASGGIDKLIRLWDAETGKLLRTLFGVGWDGIVSLQFSHDGTRIASSGMGREEGRLIRVWDVKSGELENTLSDAGLKLCLAFLANGELLLTYQAEGAEKPNWQVRQWDTIQRTTKSVFPEYPGYAHALSLSPDGKALLVATAEGDVYRYSLTK